MERYNCTCHCGGSMFYKHLHDPSCDLFTHGEEAPQSKEAQLQAALDAERAENECKDTLIETLQAQLRQVEGERDHAKKMEAVQKEVADNQTWHVRQLRQLVAALPVPMGNVVVHAPTVGAVEGTYDVRIEWKEGNSFNSIRTAQFHVKENAEALAALLTYRAAQDAGKK